MEAIKDRSAGASAGSKLRYPLRSANRGKEEGPDASRMSSSRRGRPSSSVSKSVNLLNFSAKEKFAKLPRRLSNPTKSVVNPRPALSGSITPISESRMKRADNQGKADMPSTGRRKFNILTSVSYWLTQIKLAESASKHSISLGFFKLALESGCEPLQRMRQELKSYTLRHNLLSELVEVTQDLLQLYDILEDFQQLNISQKGSQLLEEAESTLNEDSRGLPERTGNLNPRSLNSETLSITEPNKKESSQKRLFTAKNKSSTTKKPVQPVAIKEANGKNLRKKPQKPIRGASNNGNDKIKNSSKKSTDEKVDPSPVEEASSEDKENMDVLSMDGGNIKQEIETS